MSIPPQSGVGVEVLIGILDLIKDPKKSADALKDMQTVLAETQKTSVEATARFTQAVELENKLKEREAKLVIAETDLLKKMESAKSAAALATKDRAAAAKELDEAKNRAAGIAADVKAKVAEVKSHSESLEKAKADLADATEKLEKREAAVSARELDVEERMAKFKALAG